MPGSSTLPACLRREAISIDEVIDQLTEIGAWLQSQPTLSHVSYFNGAYLRITTAVAGKLAGNYFEDSKRIERLDVVFMRYYTQALAGHVQEGRVPAAWRQLFEGRRRSSERLLLLILGVNAHVHNDLGQALAETQHAAQHRQDYMRVNQLIDGCINDILFDCKVRPRVAYPFYGVIMRAMIRMWRRNAWRTGQKLQDKTLGVQRVERYATRWGRVLRACWWPM